MGAPTFSNISKYLSLPSRRATSPIKPHLTFILRIICSASTRPRSRFRVFCYEIHVVQPIFTEDFQKNLSRHNPPGVFFSSAISTETIPWPGWTSRHMAASTASATSSANGQGVPQDHAEAYIWYSLAAAGGVKNAPKARDKTAARLTPDQLRAAQREMMRRWEHIQSRKK